ncbi:MAG: tetratricopeptide repeat protein [Treponema sp.]|jgi:tetratricopeptide (TPR) repeat protein|nr:tetratricopeptide repeat protein [Treponema sp.]
MKISFAGATVFFFSLAALIFSVTLNSCASAGAVSAEEYFSLGMAYYDLGKFDEAEKWLNRAKMTDKTKSASEYNLGRIAFEAGRYSDAANHFESILKTDPENVMAIKAAAYTRIKTGEIEKAEALYKRVLKLVPESADDGYNYALVLYAMEKYEETEKVIKEHEFALLENNDVLLLLARSQNAQNKVEAIDTYDKWLVNNTDSKVRYEYARALEKGEFYARALEENRTLIKDLSKDSEDPKLYDVRFTIARLLLTADSKSDDGITEMETAVSEGYTDTEALEELLKDEKISAANKDGLKNIIDGIKRNAAQKEEAEKAAASEAENAKKAGKNAITADEAPENGIDLETDVKGGSGSSDE